MGPQWHFSDKQGSTPSCPPPLRPRSELGLCLLQELFPENQQLCLWFLEKKNKEGTAVSALTWDPRCVSQGQSPWFFSNINSVFLSCNKQDLSKGKRQGRLPNILNTLFWIDTWCSLGAGWGGLWERGLHRTHGPRKTLIWRWSEQATWRRGQIPPAHRPQDKRPRVALEFVSRALNPSICCAALPVVGKGGSRKKHHVFAIRSFWWAVQEEWGAWWWALELYKKAGTATAYVTNPRIWFSRGCPWRKGNMQNARTFFWCQTENWQDKKHSASGGWRHWEPGLSLNSAHITPNRISNACPSGLGGFRISQCPRNSKLVTLH